MLRPGLVKGPWTAEEDAIIMSCLDSGITRWSEIAERIPGRIGKQCRERYFNHLDQTINKAPWSAEEDAILEREQARIGNRWCEIAQLLVGRSENSVKNRWNSAMRKRSHGEAKLSSGSRAAAAAAPTAASSADASSAIGRAEAMYQSYNNGNLGIADMSHQNSMMPAGGYSSLLSSSSSSSTSSDAALLQHQSMLPQQQIMHHMQQQNAQQQQHGQQQMQIMNEGIESAIVSPGFQVSGSSFQMSASPPARPLKGGASQKAGQKRPSERKSKMPSMTAPSLSSPLIAMQFQQQISPTSWMVPVPDDSTTATELSPSFLAMQRNQQYPSSSSSSSASSWPQQLARSQHPQRSGEILASEDISGLHQSGTAHQKFGVATMSTNDDMDEYSDNDNAEEVAVAGSKSRRRLPTQLIGGASGLQPRAVTTEADVDQQLVKQLGRSSNRLQEFGRNTVGDVDAPVPGDRYGSPPLVGGPSILPGSGGHHPHDSHLYLLSASGRLSAPSVPQIDTSPHLMSGTSNDGMGVTLSSWQLLTGLSDSRGGHNPQSSWKGKIQETPGFDRQTDPPASFDVGIGPYTSNGRLENPSNDLKRRSDQRHTPTHVLNHRNSPTLLDDSIESLADMSNDRGKKRSKGLESSEFISESSSSSSSFGRVPQMNLFFATPIGSTGLAASPPENMAPPVERGTVSPALGTTTTGSIAIPMVRHAAPAVDTFLAPFEQANSASSSRIRSTKFYSQSAMRPVPSRAPTSNQFQSSTNGVVSAALLNYGFSPLEPTGDVLGSDLGQQLGGNQPPIIDPTPVWPTTDSATAGMGEASLSHGEMSGSLSHSFSNMLVEDGGGGSGGASVGASGGPKPSDPSPKKDDFKNRGVIHELILEEDSIDV